MRSHAVALLVVGWLTSFAPPTVASQQLGIGPVMGLSFERFGPLSGGLTAFGFHRSRLTHRGPSEDLAVRIFPQGLQYEAAILGADAGLMQAIPLGEAALFVKGGASTLGVFSPSGVEISPGVAAGGGLLLRIQRRAALRIDVTRHLYFRDGETYPVWALALGLAALPPAGRNRPQ
jgi:hypothetical protein